MSLVRLWGGGGGGGRPPPPPHPPSQEAFLTKPATIVAGVEIAKGDNHFKMHPNPKRNGEVLTFQYDGYLINPTIEIVDLNGRVITIQQLDNSNQFIFNGLEKGVYFINLKSVNGEVTNTEKLIVTD